MSIWNHCHGKNYITTLRSIVWRLVEAQHISVTQGLVDTQEEHEVLEDLIDRAKPKLPEEFRHFHYLLFTPFRYPPLEYGSRFGRKFERSLWYGSIKLEAAMAETAFYRLNFLRASKAEYGVIKIWLTAFNVDVYTQSGIDLTCSPFDNYKKEISSPLSYEVSQRLGSEMREAGVEACCYISARDVKEGINVGLFTPHAFAKKEPNLPFQTWLCFSDKNAVGFNQISALESFSKTFSVEEFMVNGKLPFPAI